MAAAAKKCVMRFGLLCACDAVDKLNWAIVQIIAWVRPRSTLFISIDLFGSWIVFFVRSGFSFAFICVFVSDLLGWWHSGTEQGNEQKIAFNAFKCEQLTSLSINYQSFHAHSNFFYWPLRFQNGTNYIVCFSSQFWHKLSSLNPMARATIRV